MWYASIKNKRCDTFFLRCYHQSFVSWIHYRWLSLFACVIQKWVVFFQEQEMGQANKA
jgi:hypothetical protein